MPVDPILFTLPPSANSCWRNYKGRVILSEKYRQWREENLHHVDDRNKIEPCLFPVDVLIMVYPGRNWRKSDLDNRIKPILDQLQHCGYLLGDDTDCVKSITIRLGQKLKNGDDSYVAIELSKN